MFQMFHYKPHQCLISVYVQYLHDLNIEYMLAHAVLTYCIICWIYSNIRDNNTVAVSLAPAREGWTPQREAGGGGGVGSMTYRRCLWKDGPLHLIHHQQIAADIILTLRILSLKMTTVSWLNSRGKAAIDLPGQCGLKMSFQSQKQIGSGKLGIISTSLSKYAQSVLTT